MPEHTQRIKNHKAKVYKTAHFTEEQAQHLKESANRQERAIATKFFYAYPKGLTPSEVHPGDEYWPITSTRRAITNLTDDGILTKTDRTRPGSYGKPEHIWIWKIPADYPPRQADMFGEPESKSKAYDL